MNKRAAGVSFCFISALLLVTHYITTAIYLSNTTCWGDDLFADGLKYTGNILDILSAITCVIGIIYLILGEKREEKKTEEEKDK